MDLHNKEKEVIIDVISKNTIGRIKVYLYGSLARNIRNFESDIDILILSEDKIPNEIIRKIKIAISEGLGGTKIDIVQSTFDSKTPFVELIEDSAVLLWERQ